MQEERRKEYPQLLQKITDLSGKFSELCGEIKFIKAFGQESDKTINNRVSSHKVEILTKIQPLEKIPTQIAEMVLKIVYIEKWIKEQKEGNRDRINDIFRLLSAGALAYIVILLQSHK